MQVVVWSILRSDSLSQHLEEQLRPSASHSLTSPSSAYPAMHWRPLLERRVPSPPNSFNFSRVPKLERKTSPTLSSVSVPFVDGEVSFLCSYHASPELQTKRQKSEIRLRNQRSINIPCCKRSLLVWSSRYWREVWRRRFSSLNSSNLYINQIYRNYLFKTFRLYLCFLILRLWSSTVWKFISWVKFSFDEASSCGRYR